MKYFNHRIRHSCTAQTIEGEDGVKSALHPGFQEAASFPGVHVVAQGGDGTADLIASMIRHRDFERETDPPMV